MENLIFTQLSIPEVRQMFRQELENYFANSKRSNKINQDQNEVQFLTIKEAADFLNLTVPTLYGYVHRAEIPVCKRGKRLYFPKQDLTKWINDGRKKTVVEVSQEANLYLERKGLNYEK
jgi:excisionase family DNA binding protein